MENGTSASINLTIDGTDAGLIVLTGKRPPSEYADLYFKRGANVYIGSLGGPSDGNDEWTIELASLGDEGGSDDGGNDQEEPPVDGEVGIPEDVTTYEITDGTQEVFGGHTFALHLL